MKQVFVPDSEDAGVSPCYWTRTGDRKQTPNAFAALLQPQYTLAEGQTHLGLQGKGLVEADRPDVPNLYIYMYWCSKGQLKRPHCLVGGGPGPILYCLVLPDTKATGESCTSEYNMIFRTSVFTQSFYVTFCIISFRIQFPFGLTRNMKSFEFNPDLITANMNFVITITVLSSTRLSWFVWKFIINYALRCQL